MKLAQVKGFLQFHAIDSLTVKQNETDCPFLKQIIITVGILAFNW